MFIQKSDVTSTESKTLQFNWGLFRMEIDDIQIVWKPSYIL